MRLPQFLSLFTPKRSVVVEKEPEGYSQFKFQLVTNSDSIQLGAVKFYSYHNQLLRPKTVTCPRGSSQWNNNPSNLIDENCEMFWKDDNYRSHGESTLIFHFTSPAEIIAYECFTSSNSPEYDPIEWIVYGKQDGYENWDLLDKRMQIAPPTERNCTYGLFEFNNGETSCRASIEDCSTPTRHLDPMQLRLFTSCEVASLWSTTRDEICSEYNKINTTIAIDHTFMSDTILQRCLSHLDKLITMVPFQRTFRSELIDCIQKVFDIPRAEVKFFVLDDISYFNSIMSLYESFSWRCSYLQAAIRLMPKDSSINSQLLLRELASSSDKSKSLKIESFHSFIHQVVLFKTKSSGNQEEKELKKLKDSFLRYLDDHKIKAFRSAFMEPIAYYYKVTSNSVVSESSASNVFAALLLSTLGIQIPFMPYLLDEVQYCPPFLRADELKKAYSLMSRSKYFGKDWNGIEYCANNIIYKNIIHLPSSFMGTEKCTVIDIANRAIDHSEKEKEFRDEIAMYMQRYAKFFTEKFIYPKIFTYLQHSCESELKSLYERKCQIDKDETLIQWIKPPNKSGKSKFDVSRAHELFSHIGIVKQ